MLDSLAARPDPLFFLFVLFPVSLGALALAYVLAVRHGKDEDGRGEAAFGLGQAAIFGLIALILGFSFAFAAERFEASRALIVDEAVAIGKVNAHADFLPAALQKRFRATLVSYTRARLDAYADTADEHAEGEAAVRSEAIHGRLWAMATGAARSDPHNLLSTMLVESVDEAGDITAKQTAALNNHVPGVIVALVLLASIAGAVLLGLTFGRAKCPNAALSIIFCLICAATVFTIVDLDDGRRGFIRLDVTPLQDILNDITPAAAH